MPAHLETAGEQIGRPPTASAPPPEAEKLSSKAFRQFLDARREKGSRGAVPVNARVEKLITPTEERLNKSDHPLKTAGGYYRVPAPIERLRNQGKLDPKPRINEAMYTAAVTLQDSFYRAGLESVIKSQDLTGLGGGGTTAASHMPVSMMAAHHRQKFLTACKHMGWYEAYPNRGCGRLVVDIICRERSLEAAGQKHFSGTRNSSALSLANDRLREGLFMLAAHWRLI